ncbi:MAG: type II toxin-antitoxin system HigB family toxin [Tepidisphaeraceae bacterium]
MQVIAFTIAEKFARKHRDANTWLARWREIVEAAEWHNLVDIREDFPQADGVKLKSRIVVTVFNVKGNEYRLLTFVQYEDQTVLVLDVMTHAEYSRDTWKDRF